MYLIPPTDFLGCSLRVVFLATSKLPFCDSCPLLRIQTYVALPLVVALVLDPECSLRCTQGSSIFVGEPDPFWHCHLRLSSALISIGYMVGLVRLRCLCLTFICSIMPVLFLQIEKNNTETSWAVSVFKDPGSTNDSSGFPRTMRLKSNLEVRQLKSHVFLSFPVSPDYAKSYTDVL